MDYATAALAALLTFITPCVLPMLPVYVTYFTAGERGKLRTLFKVLAFCLGLSIFFIVFFATVIAASFWLDSFLATYGAQVNAIIGMIMVLMGLKIMGYLNLPFLDKSINIKTKGGTDGEEEDKGVNLVNALVMGLVFSLSLGSCALGFIMTAIGPILTGAGVGKSILIAVIYIVVLNMLFVICAMLIDQLKSVFGFIKRHYRVINLVSGILLVIIGVATALGLMQKLAVLLYTI